MSRWQQKVPVDASVYYKEGAKDTGYQIYNSKSPNELLIIGRTQGNKRIAG